MSPNRDGEEGSRELAGVMATFQGSPLLIGGNFNVRLEAKNMPNDMGGRDLDFEDFWTFIVEVADKPYPGLRGENNN